jgi:site-specific recombinase XerD
MEKREHLLDQFLAKFEGKSSYKVYRSEISQFFRFYTGELTEITPEVLARYRGSLSAGAKSVKRKFSILSQFFKFCEGEISGFQNPLSDHGSQKAIYAGMYAESETITADLDQWTETLVCDSTKKLYSGHISLFFRWAEKAPADIKQSDFVAYRDYLLKEKRKNSTIWNRFIAINGFFKFLSGRSRKFKNPLSFKDLKLIPPRKDTGYYQVLTENEIRNLLDQPDTSELIGKRDHAMLRLLCTYGLRAGEVCKIRFGDIETERVKGQQKIWIRDRKGRIGRRLDTDIILNGHALAAWDDWLNSCEYTFDAETPVFLPFFYNRNADRIELNKKGAMRNRPLTVMTVETILNGYLETANIQTGNRKISPHALRHSAFTLLAHAGIELVDLKHLAAHQDVATTMIYLHAVQSYDDHVGLHSPINL